MRSVFHFNEKEIKTQRCEWTMFKNPVSAFFSLPVRIAGKVSVGRLFQQYVHKVDSARHKKKRQQEDNISQSSLCVEHWRTETWLQDFKPDGRMQSGSTNAENEETRRTWWEEKGKGYEFTFKRVEFAMTERLLKWGMSRRQRCKIIRLSFQALLSTAKAYIVFPMRLNHTKYFAS